MLPDELGEGFRTIGRPAGRLGLVRQPFQCRSGERGGIYRAFARAVPIEIAIGEIERLGRVVERRQRIGDGFPVRQHLRVEIGTLGHSAFEDPGKRVVGQSADVAAAADRVAGR